MKQAIIFIMILMLCSKYCVSTGFFQKIVLERVKFIWSFIQIYNTSIYFNGLENLTNIHLLIIFRFTAINYYENKYVNGYFMVYGNQKCT